MQSVAGHLDAARLPLPTIDVQQGKKDIERHGLAIVPAMLAGDALTLLGYRTEGLGLVNGVSPA